MLDGGSILSERGIEEIEAEARVRRSKLALRDAASERRRAARRSELIRRQEADAARKGNLAHTAERAQHGNLVESSAVATEDGPAQAGARMRRVQSPVERYAKRGTLTERQAEAARDLRLDWEFGIAGARDRSMTGIGGGFAGYTAAQLDAATAYRMAVQAMGIRLSAIVLPVVIGDAAGGEITCGTLAKRRGDKTEQRVVGIFSTGLDVLADHYERCGDHERAAKYG